MAEAPAVQATEVIGDDQDNPEVFYTVERDESGEVVCLCSDMGEAYSKIATLAEYLLKDQQDAPADEHFESLLSDITAAEGSGGCAEAKNRGRAGLGRAAEGPGLPPPTSPKTGVGREVALASPCLSSLAGCSSEAPEAKRPRLANSPALCIVSGNPVAIPPNPCQDGTISPPDFHVEILVATAEKWQLQSQAESRWVQEWHLLLPRRPAASGLSSREGLEQMPGLGARLRPPSLFLPWPAADMEEEGDGLSPLHHPGLGHEHGLPSLGPLAQLSPCPCVAAGEEVHSAEETPTQRLLPQTPPSSHHLGRPLLAPRVLGWSLEAAGQADSDGAGKTTPPTDSNGASQLVAFKALDWHHQDSRLTLAGLQSLPCGKEGGLSVDLLPLSFPGSSANPEFWCFPQHMSNIQMIFTFENAQQPPLSPEPPTAPELARAFCKRLKEHFCRQCQSAPQQLLGHLYLEGALVRHRPDGRRNADLRLCNPGQMQGAPVERSRLFQMPGKRDPGGSIIVVLGKAGMGKSLLAQKICLDWANGQMAQFDFVFRFDCRRLGLLHGAHRDLRPLLSDVLGGLCEGVDDVYERMLQNPERVLLLFDGMGELEDLAGFASGSPSHGEGHGIGTLLAALFQKKLLNGCTLLLTGRPQDRLPPCLPRVDTVLEVVGFSAEQASLYLARYFKGSPHGEQKENLIRTSPYLFSHCHNPGLCQLICEAVFGMSGEELPSTLTGLFTRFLLRKLASLTANSAASKHQNLTALAEVSWSLGQHCQNALLSNQFPSVAVKDFALKAGLVVEEGGVYVFPNFGVQHFLVALHLTLAKEMKGKKLTKYLGLGSRSRKFLSSWGLVPRFLSGLLFLKDDLSSSLLFGEEGELDTEKMITKKQRSLLKFIRKLSIQDFSPDKLLELLHCVHEAEDPSLLNHFTFSLRPDLSFLGFPLTPSDVSVLQSVLRRCSKEFTLDLRGSCVHVDGLRNLVDLKNVTKFRVSLGEAVALWKHLWGIKERGALQTAMEKFLLVPFRAQTMEDVDSLLKLVQLQREMAEGGHLIPAIAGLLKLEFSLGPSCGLEGFQKLAESLVAFPALQHLDLDSPDENEIGDDGMKSLSGILPRLASLETLNLSRNKITDLGAEPLARALPSLLLLKTLSLYKNNIGDAGAGRFAEMLPQMSALRVLDLHCNKISAAGAQRLTDCLRKCPRIQSLALWNPTIPHGVLDHLQQLDSRIRRF
ncbi:MHC class II transactivator [Candoia aspera]|uniref:MHC class II transactivator n=1 Tax=Candoia aspera TaxID=51853 RepID=UPI002FD7FDE3